VVVVGSGCAGLTSAIVAAKQGLKVLVVEKSKYFGGTTAYSGGGAWIPVNKHQPAIGVTDDSREKAETYLQRVLGPELYDPSKIKAFLDSGPEMVRWIEENSSMKFKPVPLPDYHVSKEGSSVGRTMLTQEFDGQVLGRRRLRDVRYTLQGFHAFGSMQADPVELAVLTRPFASLQNFSTATAKLVRYVIDVVRFGKGAFMANGNALVGRLLHTCDQEGVSLWKSSPAVSLTHDPTDKVTGVVIAKENGETETVEARKAVILASGGFGRSEKARKYLPHDHCAAPKHNVGDGIKLAVEVGAVLPPANPDNGIFAPISVLTTKTGQVRRFPHFAIDRSKPGSIIVGPDGRRFANESAPYQEFVRTMHQLNISKAYFIGDRPFLRKYGMGMALPAPLPVRHLIRQGYLIEAPSIEQLAHKIGVPADVLQQTVSQANENARKGKDPEFQRGGNAYDNFYGDPATGLPNPNLGLCVKGPFYALPIYPGNVSSVYGVATNENAQALDSQGKPIPGLYAIGLDQNSVMRGTYPGGGCSIGPSMTFGYRSALHVAGKL